MITKVLEAVCAAVFATALAVLVYISTKGDK